MSLMDQLKLKTWAEIIYMSWNLLSADSLMQQPFQNPTQMQPSTAGQRQPCDACNGSVGSSHRITGKESHLSSVNASSAPPVSSSMGRISLELVWKAVSKRLSSGAGFAESILQHRPDIPFQPSFVSARQKLAKPMTDNVA